MKNKNLSYRMARLPSVEECEKCAFQDECDGGKYCVPSAKKGQPTIHNKVIDKHSSRAKCKVVRT